MRQRRDRVRIFRLGLRLWCHCQFSSSQAHSLAQRFGMLWLGLYIGKVQMPREWCVKKLAVCSFPLMRFL